MLNQAKPEDAAELAAQLASLLEARGVEYALGGAIALGFWSQPRGTLDIDITLFLDKDTPNDCTRLLESIGCDLIESEAVSSLTEHGYCRVA